jgi:predicted DNA-binding protein (MmcQ/YjbR family)
MWCVDATVAPSSDRPRAARLTSSTMPTTLDDVLAELRELAHSLPGAEAYVMVHHPAFRVGKKPFAIAGMNGGPTLTVNLGVEMQHHLLDDARFTRTPYIGQHGWVTIDRGACRPGEVQSLVVGSWERVASKKQLAERPKPATAVGAPAKQVGTAKRVAKAKRVGTAKRVGKAEANTASATAERPRIHTIPFASVYPLYVQKVERKGRTQAELDQVIAWLTGYRGPKLKRAIDSQVDLETFFARAPAMSPHLGLITGVVCGVRVEEITDPVTQKIRYLDKLVDELARGKKMESILRA